MTHLHSIRLRGFKTFARPTELLFEPGVTVIIGPNGSGKSNVADAMLWVLGEQSPGNLRGRTMQDVIFSGPDGRRSAAVAEVSLVFDNEDGALPLDAAQVEVSRRLLRESGSEYRLNGSACRLLDVQDLFGGLGLGREMHSVISQGKVDAVLNSTPEVRRAIVEEAAGLGRFKKRRERTRSKLERTRQNLLRIGDVEREVKNALRPLRQQVAAAERFAQAAEEWALAKGRSVVFELAGTEKACREVDSALNGHVARKTQMEVELAALRKQRADDEEEFTSALEEREGLGGAYHLVHAEAGRLEARALALRQRLAHNEGELDRARRRRDLAESQLASLRLQVEWTAGATADEGRLAVVSAALQRLQAALDELLPTHRAAMAREDDLKDEVFELESARSRALQDREFLRREVTEKERVAGEVGQLRRDAAGRLGELDQRGEQLRARAAEAKKLAGEARERAAAAAARRDDARERLDAAAREERHIAEGLSGLEARQTVLRDVLGRREGTPAAVRALVERGEGCRLLTELLSVEPGYERALAVALGPVAQAAVAGDGHDPAGVLRGQGPLEVIWRRNGDGAAERRQAPPSERPPAGFRPLWELVSGPKEIMATLGELVPPTAVLVDDAVELTTAARGGAGAGWRLVSRTGEIVTTGLHAARRTEAGVEAVLRARNELSAVTAQMQTLSEQRAEARQEAEAAREGLKSEEDAHRQAEEALRQADREALAAANEVDLHARRAADARSQLGELAAREEKERQLAAQLQTDLVAIEERLQTRERELEEARVGLRSLQAELESTRRQVAAIEEKKAQATVLEVRLRERCRGQQAERERVRSQLEAAAADAARSGRRVELLALYGPDLARLLAVVERLAERARAVSQELEGRVAEARSRADSAAQVIREWGGVEATLQREHDELATTIAQAQVEQARSHDRRALLEEELAELRRKHLSPRTLTAADVAGEDPESLAAALQRAEQRRDRIGPVNPLAEQECAEMEERARFLSEQRRDLEASLAQLQDVITGLDEHINTSFAEIFATTRENFETVIATIFPGAKGTLALTEGRSGRAAEGRGSERGPAGAGTSSAGLAQEGDEDEEAAPGISLAVKFPNKAPRSMSLLSGGEKAMTAIAFLFSLFLARPCPFYILDEVEASLDDINIRRFLSLIRRYRDKTQFIIITHQRQTMEIADTLYGIALESDGTSRVLSRRLGGKRPPGVGEDDGTAHLLAKEA